jgi:hypothetical protein
MFNRELVYTQLALISLCNYIFAVTYLLLLDSKLLHNLPKIKYVKGEYLFFYIYCVVLIFMGFLGVKFSYTAEKTGIIHSLISNFKTIMAGFYIAYLLSYGFNKKTFVMFAMFFTVLILEGSRWYFISVLFVTMAFIQDNYKIKNYKLIVPGFLFGLVLSFVGLNRVNVKIEDFSIFLSPFYIEGTYGSYMLLQTYEAIHGNYTSFYTLFTDYIFDPIIYLLPRVFFILLGVDKDNVGIFAYYVSCIQDKLSDTYAPVGGFYYLAQASSALPYSGPLIITFLYAYISVKIENNSKINQSRMNFYYIYLAGFSFVFIKTIFHQTIKYFLTILIPAYTIIFLIKVLDKRHETTIH